MLARVSSYDIIGSVLGMPIGALAAGPLAAAIGVFHTEYWAVTITLGASALALIPRDVRHRRAADVIEPGESQFVSQTR